MIEFDIEFRDIESLKEQLKNQKSDEEKLKVAKKYCLENKID